MATLLYRLGRFSYRRAWTIIAVWFVVLVGILGGSIALGGSTQESFAIPGTESQDALDKLSAVFPAVAGTAVQVVTVAPEGASVNDDKYKDAIEDQADAIEKLDGVEAVVSPFSEYAGKAISDDENMSFIRVQFDGAATDVTDEMLTDLQDTRSITEDAGMEVAFGGQVFQDNTFGITIIEVFGVVFAGVVLFITFGSLVSAGMPLLSALIGVGIVVGGITTVAAFTSVSSTAPLLALMIGLAVGIDYALFILSRHRTQLARGEDPEESAAMAVGTAGSAVVFAGITVIIALLGLLVVGIPFLSTMGVGAAFAVLVAICIATTLLPALLGLAKGRLAPKPGSRAYKRAVAHDGETGTTTMGMRWVKGVMKVPVLATIGVVALLGVVAIPAFSLQLSLPDNGSEPAASTQREAYDLIADGFGAGFNGPLIVSVDITQTIDILDDLEGVRSDLEGLDGVAYVGQCLPDETLDTAICQVVSENAPNSEETKALVQEIRDLGPTIANEYDTPITVTGATAIGIDISNRLSDALIPFGTIVVGLSILLLMMVFRSVLVPIKAALGFLLSVGASFGVVVAIFQWGWFADLLHIDVPGPILSFLPILLMAVLFGLAMDYELFLVSGMREEFVKTGDARYAVAHGFANGARVVTAAALIMFFVFFAFVPEGSGAIKPIALGLAVGIAVDAFLVRMTLVPAIMTLLGKAAWWMPRWLSNLLPNVDVEGEQLREHRDAVEWARGQDGAVISAENLVVGSRANPIGPLTFRVSPGSLVVASGEPGERRLLAATLGGRLDPVAGLAQVAGHPLPSEAASVAGLVALADLGGTERTEASVTVGELLAERIELTQPWYSMFRTGRGSERWLERINSAIEQVTDATNSRITAQSTLLELPQLERAITLAALALCERTPVVMLDQLDAFASTEDERAFITAIDLLAPATTTVVIGTPVPARALDVSMARREVAVLDLDESHQLEASARHLALESEVLTKGDAR
ncbi:MMPL family transporter [Glaciihabitans arcticus]|uniref:MMPL family transporter n=1 Tax=Glaciihabitans arcticus TaxID=2668039 RepID=A0A4Q9GV26_9MICO|nr:MMPL family transporter [Glaciihabitans arcticus]TBN56030.1 MMPL family transporter [Glaciihabitans arcticus]